MKPKKAPIILFLFCLTLPFISFSQTAQRALSRKLPENFKLERSLRNLAAYRMAGLSFAKSVGKTPEEYGKYMGELFAKTWELPKKHRVNYFVGEMSGSYRSDENFKMDITHESVKQIKAKMNRFMVAPEKILDHFGLTKEELDDYRASYWTSLAGMLGLQYQEEIKEDMVYFVVTDPE